MKQLINNDKETTIEKIYVVKIKVTKTVIVNLLTGFNRQPVFASSDITEFVFVNKESIH